MAAQEVGMSGDATIATWRIASISTHSTAFIRVGSLFARAQGA